ncbi:ABC transporter ATP-binding protein [Paenarthrobacter ureafaciens]|uniref:ABC transporter ATP-binding protein n=1 Tax=Paenarthrobacter ureafaciens TaxID=37931 RepID=UPI001FB520C0|nr:ABC transporter ATP-binding protein [Paenarthrobacter ureafaciens]UOD82944.1 ABC transporter ATP-binding protein [Paenarthrobacter ureafaciens]WNZ02651.1 ABC transporter ATP-binding protein [Paenarthrobacter ureafaciens]
MEAHHILPQPSQESAHLANPPAAVECSALSKAFGRHVALDAIDLHVPPGSIFGLVGPNGAGKTTLLRILTGLSRASAGSVHLLGRELRADDPDVRRDIGYLPDVPAFYAWMTSTQALRLAGRLSGLDGAELNGRIRDTLQLVRLEAGKQRIGKYSRGMRQRLGVAQALINTPKLLLLDEPTSALDPAGRKELLDFLVTLRGRTTVFFSTHILGDVERVCDHVAVLDKGKVLSQSTMEELRARHGQQTIAVEVTDGAEQLAHRIAQAPWALSVRPGPGGEIMVRATDPAAAQRGIPALVASAGIGLVRLDSAELSLEDVFLELTGVPAQ